MSNSHSRLVCRTTVLALAGALACGRSDGNTADSSGGSLAAQRMAADTMPETAAPPVAGFALITPNDARSVRDAMEYKLTNENFARFIRASDSLAALRARDTSVRALFAQRGAGGTAGDTAAAAGGAAGGGAGAQRGDQAAGLERLERNPAVSAAITGTGMSVRDYVVAAIAIGQAERFMNNPGLAPPTPALPANAEFLRAHQQELAALRARESGQPAPVQAR
jgi:hypothetical protein